MSLTLIAGLRFLPFNVVVFAPVVIVSKPILLIFAILVVSTRIQLEIFVVILLAILLLLVSKSS